MLIKKLELDKKSSLQMTRPLSEAASAPEAPNCSSSMPLTLRRQLSMAAGWRRLSFLHERQRRETLPLFNHTP